MNITKFTQKESYFKNTKIALGQNINWNNKNFDFSDQILQISGQGTFSVSLITDQEFEIFFVDDKENLNDAYAVILKIGLQETCFYELVKGKKNLLLKTDDKCFDAFIDCDREQTYWFSLDKEHQKLRFGKGYMLSKLIVFEYKFPNSVSVDWLSKLKYIGIQNIHSKFSSIYWRYPVTEDIPAMIIDNNQITLDDLDKNTSTVIEDLSHECIYLYSNVAGQKIQLNTSDFPDFASAINYSIVTPECLCYEKLKEKATEFGKFDPNETYLRITVGINKGDSPGIPFVLEIWPGGHYSPIHNHSDANAIIKVLHGSLTVEWFRSLNKQEMKYYDKSIAAEGQVTWLNDRQFQTHRLFNHNVKGNMCATIQCYMYNNSDTNHYEYFDYLDSDGNIQKYTPDSDWDYSEFKKCIHAEWQTYKQTISSIKYTAN